MRISREVSPLSRRYGLRVSRISTTRLSWGSRPDVGLRHARADSTMRKGVCPLTRRLFQQILGPIGMLPGHMEERR
jgi:hypothetical protein